MTWENRLSALVLQLCPWLIHRKGGHRAVSQSHKSWFVITNAETLILSLHTMSGDTTNRKVTVTSEQG